jgi:hypothetical protein
MKNFRQLDDLVLDLKGLVLVRELLRERGTDVAALETEIDQVRNRLARFVSGPKPGPKPGAAARSSRRVVPARRRGAPGGTRRAEIQLLT